MENQGQFSKTQREDFFNSFIWTLLQTENHGPDGEEQPLAVEHDVEDISQQVLEGLKQQCNAFIDQNTETLGRVGKEGYSLSQAGHDFCLSRNGHGAGFFDRDLEEDGDRLQDAAEQMGSCEAYLGDDGKIYVLGLERYGQQEKPRNPGMR